MPSYPGFLKRIEHEVMAHDLQNALALLKKADNVVRKTYPLSTLPARRAAKASQAAYKLLSAMDGQFQGERHEGFQDVYMSGPPDSRYLVNGKPSRTPTGDSAPSAPT